MKIRSSLVTSAVAIALGALAASSSTAADFHREQSHGVFVMSNNADANEVLAFERNGNGSLRQSHPYRTGGRGSGGTLDPLTSQGSLTLSSDGNWLFAVNAGSGTLSVFRVEGARLFLTDEVATGGSEPNAVAEHDGLVYVLNTAGSSNVVGFRLNFGHLRRIDDSLRLLSGNNVGSASVAFDRDGKFLVVTERGTDTLDVFSVLPNGKLTTFTSTPSAAPGAFAAIVAPNGTVIVSETGAGGQNDSTVSSYAIQGNRALAVVSRGIGTNGAANCWNAVTPDGRFVYASNSATASISGFAISPRGALAPLTPVVSATNPAGAVNLDIAISADGAFLYSLNAAAGTIGVFEINKDTGALKSFGSLAAIPAGAGANGIAAN